MRVLCVWKYPLLNLIWVYSCSWVPESRRNLSAIFTFFIQSGNHNSFSNTLSRMCLTGGLSHNFTFLPSCPKVASCVISCCQVFSLLHSIILSIPLHFVTLSYANIITTYIKGGLGHNYSILTKFGCTKIQIVTTSMNMFVLLYFVFIWNESPGITSCDFYRVIIFAPWFMHPTISFL